MNLNKNLSLNDYVRRLFGIFVERCHVFNVRGMARLLNLRIKKTISLYNPKHNDFYPEIIPLFFYQIYLQRRILKHALIRSRF
jgi:hypothetical protein